MKGKRRNLLVSMAAYGKCYQRMKAATARAEEAEYQLRKLREEVEEMRVIGLIRPIGLKPALPDNLRRRLQGIA